MRSMIRVTVRVKGLFQSRISFGLLHTHLDEPLCQQINCLSHSRVVFREKLDDMFWRTTCLEIPARETSFLLSNFQWAFMIHVPKHTSCAGVTFFCCLLVT